jgi:L-seryl-tRNA(Ser) seleniumtransferase
MPLPSFLKDILPSESVKQWMDLVTQPNLVAGLKDAAQQLGWKESWGTTQLQHSILQAKKWLEMFQERWQAGNPGRLKLGINATGKLVSSSWSNVPLPPAAISMQAYMASGYSRPESLADELERTVCKLTNAEACFATHNLELAVSAVASSIEDGRRWAIARADCIRFASGVDLVQLLGTSGGHPIEIGASNSCSAADWQQAGSYSVGGFFGVSPSRLANPLHAEDRSHIRLQSTSSGEKPLWVEILLDGSLLELAPIGMVNTTPIESFQAGSDIVIAPGNGLIGGPESGLVIGRSELIHRIKAHAQARGLVAGTATTAALHAAILAGNDVHLWRETPIGAMLSNGVENLVHRAKRLSMQLTGLPGLAEVENGREVFALADSPIESIRAESGFVRFKPKTLSIKDAQLKLAQRETPIWSVAEGDKLLLVMRSIDPADDNEIVQAFEAVFAE